MSMILTVQLSYDLNGRVFAVTPAQYTITPGDGLASGVVEIGTAAEAVPLGGIATPGFAVFTNLDATNYLEIGYDSSGFVAVMKIPVGASVLINLDGVMAAPWARSSTAATLLSYTIAEKA